MSGRGSKYASMGVSHRDGDNGQDGDKQKYRKNKYRRQGGGNFIGQRAEGGTAAEDLRPQLAQQRVYDEREAELGWPMFTEGEPRLGWLLNFTTTSYEDEETGNVRSAVDCYFMCQDGSMFKARVPHLPYFYLQVKDGQERDVEGWLRRKFEGRLQDVLVEAKEDLDLPNHLSGLKRSLLKLSFWNVQALMDVRKEVAPIIAANKNRSAVNNAYSLLQQQQQQQLMMAEQGPGAAAAPPSARDLMDAIMDMREYDVPYHVRFAIDTDVRAGHWFTVTATDGVVSLSRRADLLTRAEPVICAWDIETTKLPLQFPNAEYDQIFMISYMIDRQGYLLCNREVVGADVSDFEFTPKPEYDGPFKVVNVPNEKALLEYWFQHMRQVQPAVYVSYNGDFFDFPFVATRAAKHGLDLEAQLGFALKGTEWLSRAAVHMDCLHWVNRDSYLPQGSRGLKAVCKAKLGYDPVEVGPEDMVRLAQEQPQAMASYSVSDAVATYYLYMTYIHPFIFSLATIIPMPPDEVLRKGSGTLCEQLLMVEAYRANIIAPNKHTSVKEPMYKGHLLDSETYIGGKVEAIESGVFRADLPTKFKCTAEAYQQLIDNLDRDLGYAITHDAGWKMEDVGNYEEVKAAIRTQLEALRDTPNRLEVPLIYHLDVAAMYPNIILTNRLQPPAIVTEEDCAACDFNKPGKTCLRQMEWVWRGEHFACTRAEMQQIKRQLQTDPAPLAPGSTEVRYWKDLNSEEQGKLLKDRLKKYCQKVYKRVLDKPVQERRLAGVCQRENSFYVDTVKAFRDRRYEYKGLNKKWKGKLEVARSSGNALATAEAADMVVLYDSLQLAHKCILNSFYGYVMRKGARWYSMEMAGVVTNTGAGIIQNACRLVEQLGKPLELDTDGIWCALPGSFPEDFKFKNAASGKDFRISYPCVMLNVMVAEKNTNDQYQDLVDPVNHIYETSSQMSIEFEVDGPYKAMILPASKEEGKLIKKRYAVFNFDGSLAELKGFEIKRRGELKLIKVFQGEVFEQFLAGSTLEECYGAVGAIANRWLDMLDTQGMDLTDTELLDYISESTTMSKGMDEYEGRKSCAITTAKRLAQFLGDERIKDKGLSCQYIIARCPEGQPTSERAIPVSIFSAEPAVARTWLRSWCGDVGSAGAGEVPDVRDILDWAYYRERLGSAIQKIITIPAAMQHVANPVPRIKHPDWLTKLVRARDDKCQQRTLKSMFAGKADKQQQKRPPSGIADLEDFGGASSSKPPAAGKQLGRAWLLAAPSSTDADPTAAAGGSGHQLDDDTRQPDQLQQQQQQPAELPPDWQEDYSGWLQAQKRKWQSERQERKRRKLAAARQQRRRPARDADGGGDDEDDVDAGGAAAPAAGNLTAYLRQQQKAVARSSWQVLQLAPTRVPGEYRMWVVVESALSAVTLRVPRRLIINSSLDPEAPGSEVLGQPTKALLPTADVPLNLYELLLPERDFQSRLNSLSIQLLQAGARGVYEDQLPLDVSAALALGGVVRLAPGARQRNWAKDGLDLADLQMVPASSSSSYLEGGGPEGLGPLRYAALYQSQDAAGHRSTNILLLPAANRCIVQIVAPHALGAKEVTAAALDRSWQELLPHFASGPSQTTEVSSMNFTVEYFRDKLSGARSLQQHLMVFKDKHGPLLVAVQAPGGYRRLQADIPQLAHVPCTNMPVAPEDVRYPVLQWQLRAARRGLQAVAVTSSWLQERVALARYAGVPLATLGGDASMAMASLLFARGLRELGHVLWWRDSALPDIGIQPLPQEDYFLVEELPAGSLSCPGAYRTVCVQLQLHHLAVAALDQAAAMAEMEGAEGLEALGAGSPAFKVLRGLVQGWLADATRGNNPMADHLLQQAYRWISNPAGPLYDAGLHRVVAGLMQRMFLGLVVEMQRLGAQLVAADFHSITINTRKRNLSAAVSYTQYLLSTVGRQDLFRWLRLVPTTWWHVLHYADRFNWGGVQAALPAGFWQRTWSQQQQPGQPRQGEEPGEGGEGGGSWLSAELEAELDEVDTTQIGEVGGPRLESKWNLLDFLPPEVAHTAQLVLAEFMFRPWVAAAAAVRAGATQGGSQAAADARDALQIQVDYLRKELSGSWGESLLNKVEVVSLSIPEGCQNPGGQFPLRAGSHLTPEELGSPALALVRTLTHLMGLDAEVAEEVMLLRRRMLRLLGVGEFTPAVVFQDPCMSFKLEEVICSHCNHVTDMDLCRDSSLPSGDWPCSICGEPYDKARIEARLVSMLQSRLKEYALQDLTCVRCKELSTQRLRSQCTHCGGALVNTVPAELAEKRLTVFHNLGVHYGFNLLQQLADMALHNGHNQAEPGLQDG